MENQNTPENDAFELLKNVIISNENNTQKVNDLETAMEDFLNLMGETESTIRGVSSSIIDVTKNISQPVELVLSEPTRISLENNTKQHKFNRFSQYFSITVSFIALLIIIFTSKLSFEWYQESIRTKTELRQEIMEEIKKDGQDIYKTEDYQQLKYNTDLMNKWIKKNPKDADRFLRFKEGYESR